MIWDPDSAEFLISIDDKSDNPARTTLTGVVELSIGENGQDLEISVVPASDPILAMTAAEVAATTTRTAGLPPGAEAGGRSEQEGLSEGEPPRVAAATAPPAGKCEFGTPTRAEPSPTEPIDDQTQNAVLVELIYELDAVPLADRPLPSAATDREPRGYVLLKRGAAHPTDLYPARGEPLPEEDQPVLWIGVRYRNLLFDRLADRKTLRAAATGRYRLDEADLGLIAPVIPFQAVLEKDGTVRTDSGDCEVLLKAGDHVPVAVAERAFEREAFADTLIAGVRGRNPDAAPDRAKLIEQLSAAFPGDEPIRFYGRLSVIHHGEVRIGAFDVLHEWREARRLAVEGPYVWAREALQNVLAVVPDHEAALTLLAQVSELIANNAEAATISGRVVFATGHPTEEERATWRQFGSGFASLARPGDAAGSGIASAPIEDGRFVIHVPTGEYRLTVAVPGLEPVERIIDVEGDTEINVPVPSTD